MEYGRAICLNFQFNFLWLPSSSSSNDWSTRIISQSIDKRRGQDSLYFPNWLILLIIINGQVYWFGGVPLSILFLPLLLPPKSLSRTLNSTDTQYLFIDKHKPPFDNYTSCEFPHSMSFIPIPEPGSAPHKFKCETTMTSISRQQQSTRCATCQVNPK